MPQGIDRLFTRMHAAESLTSADVEARLARQREFDSDIWIVEVEDRSGCPFLDLATP